MDARLILVMHPSNRTIEKFHNGGGKQDCKLEEAFVWRNPVSMVALSIYRIY